MHYLYKIARVDSDDVYVGVTNDPFKRWQEHFENDSVVGRCLREHGLAGFAFSFIGVYVSRADAEKAERIWIQENNPKLNDAGRTGLASGLDTEKLADNEHFQILRLDSANNIVVLIKTTGKEQRISIAASNQILLLLAPLNWWNKLLGETLARRHMQQIVGAMIQITKSRAQFDTESEGLLYEILNAEVSKDAANVTMTVKEMLGNWREFGSVLAKNAGIKRQYRDSSLVCIAPTHKGLQRLLRKTMYVNVKLYDVLINHEGAACIERMQIGHKQYRNVVTIPAKQLGLED